jgi:hypothetical protein
LIGSGALPDNGVCERFAGIFIPDHGGFPLIGDTNGGQIRTGKIRISQGAANDILGVPPDFKGIMFHPARLGKNLFMFFLIHTDDPAVVIKNDEAVTGCTLI